MQPCAHVSVIAELKFALQQKSAQLETAKERQAELEQQLIKREETITHQKRTLKCVKEEYQEKFKVCPPTHRLAAVDLICFLISVPSVFFCRPWKISTKHRKQSSSGWRIALRNYEATIVLQSLPTPTELVSTSSFKKAVLVLLIIPFFVFSSQMLSGPWITRRHCRFHWLPARVCRKFEIFLHSWHPIRPVWELS